MPDTELAKQLNTTRFAVQKRRIEKGIPAFVFEDAPGSELDYRLPYNWTPNKEMLLGTQPDPVIAERLNLEPSTVTRRRHALEIDSFIHNQPIEWTRGMIDLLGEVPDSHLSAEYEISAGPVKIKRIEEGIPPYRSRWMDPEPDLPSAAIRLIGKIPDKQIADKFNILRYHIRVYRALHGIPVVEYERPTAFHWNKTHEALLGTMSDRKVAIQLGIPVDQVHHRRKTLDIPPHGVKAKITWTVSRIEQLGKMTDAQLSRQWKCSQRFIRKKREELGIVACARTRTVLTPEQVDRLGTAPDTQLAREFGVSPSFMRNQRTERGIDPHKSSKKYQWTKRTIAILGKIHDEELAMELGLSPPFVAAKRFELGIPGLRRYSKVNWSDKKVLQRLGKSSDPDVAKELGVSASAVFQQRKKHGIPPHQT